MQLPKFTEIPINGKIKEVGRLPGQGVGAVNDGFTISLQGYHIIKF